MIFLNIFIYIYIFLYINSCALSTLFEYNNTIYSLWIVPLKSMNRLILYYITGPLALMSRVFVSGLEDRGSIPGRVIPKTQKMVLDAALLSTIR